MNREIKFRAWDGKQMSKNVRTIQELANGSLKSRDADKLVWIQYTGLKDKNGKEIYDGDIVLLDHWKSSDLFDYSKPFVVEYYEGEINFKQGGYNNFKGSLTGRIKIEVIGNIFINK